METQTDVESDRRHPDGGPGDSCFRLHEHPWLVVLAVPVFSIISLLLVLLLFGILGVEATPTNQFLQSLSFHLLFILVIAPFVLRLPSGPQPFVEYLDEIRLTRLRPFGRLVLLALSCYLILALSQGAGVVVYRLTQGDPITLEFLLSIVDVSGDLPPESWSLLVALPSALEEVTFRGILLFALLYEFSNRKAIVASALAFGLIHSINLAFGRELVWVLGQIGWSFLLGLFYAFLVLKTDSLLPAMIVHYLGNVFIGSITAYIQATASVEIQVLYALVFSLGLLPTALMILWVQVVSSRWLPPDQGVTHPP